MRDMSQSRNLTCTRTCIRTWMVRLFSCSMLSEACRQAAFVAGDQLPCSVIKVSASIIVGTASPAHYPGRIPFWTYRVARKERRHPVGRYDNYRYEHEHHEMTWSFNSADGCRVLEYFQNRCCTSVSKDPEHGIDNHRQLVQYGMSFARESFELCHVRINQRAGSSSEEKQTRGQTRGQTKASFNVDTWEDAGACTVLPAKSFSVSRLNPRRSKPEAGQGTGEFLPCSAERAPLLGNTILVHVLYSMVWRESGMMLVSRQHVCSASLSSSSPSSLPSLRSTIVV